MSKALFFNIPAHGHINPSLPLVAELVKRGHKISYYATERYRERISRAGAKFFPYSSVKDDYFEAKGLNGAIPQQAALALLTTTKAILPELIEITGKVRPDYILYDCMCPWGYFLAKIMKLPSVSSFSLLPLTPRFLFNRQVAALMIPALVKGFRSGTAANRLSNDLGKQYDVKPLDQMNVLSAPGDLSISYSSSAFVPFADSLADHFRLVGWTKQESATNEVFQHQSDRKLIYVSLGTVSNENLDFFKTCIAALGDSPYDVLISTGNSFEAGQFGTLPENIAVKSWVPQSQVIQQADLFVTHGGVNSVHDGLFCGVPLLVVPQQTEQTFNAIRVVELGAGLMLKNNQLTIDAVRSSAQEVLSNPSYKKEAQRIGERLRSAGGVKRAADEIESLLKRS